MTKIRIVLVVLVLWCIVWTPFASAQTQKAWTNAPEIERRVEALLKQMTLEEKVGQGRVRVAVKSKSRYSAARSARS
jgi:uncharacterized iron-regulated membrane protein